MAKEIWQPIATNFDSDVSVLPSVRTASGGGGGGAREPQGKPTGGGECHLFLAGNRTVLLSDQRFPLREIA